MSLRNGATDDYRTGIPEQPSQRPIDFDRARTATPALCPRCGSSSKIVRTPTTQYCWCPKCGHAWVPAPGHADDESDPPRRSS
jgi:hypothetical protein